MKALETEVLAVMKEYRMIPEGGRVLVGLSGGADSVCLLEVLRTLQASGRCDLQLHAVHVHHGLRESADIDEQFVREMCRRDGIPLRVYHVDAAGEAARRGMSIEEAGRALRREIYAKEAGTAGSDTVVALAHHREDSAETMLFHLCRGSSLAGLTGIRPVSFLERNLPYVGKAVKVIRPLICSSRREIEEWLNVRGLAWREDETNSDTRYTRNYLRSEIFPRLETQVNPAAAEHMAGTARELAETEEYLRFLSEQVLTDCLVPGPQEAGCGRNEGNAVRLQIVRLTQQTGLMQRRVLYLAMSKLSSAGGRDLSAVHIRMVQNLLQARGSASADLPGGIQARKEYDVLLLELSDGAGRSRSEPDGPSAGVFGQSGAGLPLQPAAAAAAQNMSSSCSPYRSLQPAAAEAARAECFLPAGSALPLSPAEYAFRILPYSGEAVPTGDYTKWLDYDKISAPIQLRSRREGDRIAIESAQETGCHYKKLTRVMIDRKVPVRARERVVLPMDGNEVLWFPGWRISARHRVDPQTRQILEITWRPASDHLS